ncbi:MAG: hypothetical protein CBD58_00375 [bacterium TMED198]|nr:MAG: hypothetical protein CBD58_00375 [bacterium TMED198]
MILQIGYIYNLDRDDLLINLNYLVSKKTFLTANFSSPSSFYKKRYNFYNSYIFGYKIGFEMLSAKYSSFLFGVHRNSTENHINVKWYNIGLNNLYQFHGGHFLTNFIYSFNRNFIEKSISINSILYLSKDLFINFGIGYTSIYRRTYSMELGLVL